MIKIEKKVINPNKKYDKKIILSCCFFKLGDKIVSESCIREYIRRNPNHYVIVTELDEFINSLKMEDIVEADEFWTIKGYGENTRSQFINKFIYEAFQDNVNYIKTYHSGLYDELRKIRVERSCVFLENNELRKAEIFPRFKIKNEYINWLHGCHKFLKLDKDKIRICFHFRNCNSSTIRNVDPEIYGKFALKLKEYGFEIINVGSKEDLNLDLNKYEIIDFSKDNLSVNKTAVLISTCDLYIGGETGTTMLAAAIGIPIIAISYINTHALPYTKNCRIEFKKDHDPTFKQLFKYVNELINRKIEINRIEQIIKNRIIKKSYNKEKIDKCIITACNFQLGDKIVSELYFRKFREQNPNTHCILLETTRDIKTFSLFNLSLFDEHWVIEGNIDFELLLSNLISNKIDRFISLQTGFGYFYDKVKEFNEISIFNFANSYKIRKIYPIFNLENCYIEWAKNNPKFRYNKGRKIICFHIRNIDRDIFRNMDCNLYIDIMKTLKKYNFEVINIGSLEDDEIPFDEYQIVDFSKDNLNVFQTAALIKLSNLFVGGETGTTMLAASLNVPIVASSYVNKNVIPYIDSKKCNIIFKGKNGNGYTEPNKNIILNSILNMLNYNTNLNYNSNVNEMIRMVM